jgi:YebC/PmpR family DNA-binding regulatory protein
MSGHSKWSSIKHKKGAADAKRGQLFSKLSRAIIVAAREGGPDPAANLALQNAIDKARSYSMPKDNIERAIARGGGSAGEGTAYELVTYEGYAPGGVALFVEALTDNRNRTASDIRHVFSKHDGSLGESGSVAWLFEKKGVVLVDAEGVDEDELTLAAAEGGAEDVAVEGSTYQITSAQEDVRSVREALEEAGFAVDSTQITMLPKTTIEIGDEGAARKVLRLMESLEDVDDVQDVYSNFDIPEQVLEQAAA